MAHELKLDRRIAALAALLVSLCVSDGAAADRQAGMGVVVSATGQVTLRHGRPPQPASEGAALRSGDTLLVAPGGSCRGFDPAGKPFTLDGPAEAVFSARAEGGALGSIGAWVSRQVADWVGTGRDQPLLTRSIRSWDLPCPAPQPFLPANGGRARTGKVRLRWGGVAGIQRYEVVIAPSTGAESTRTATQADLTLDDLKPGDEYVWKIRPVLEGWPGSSSWSTFKILSEEEEGELDRALQGLGDLEAGVLLLTSGLHEEAVLRFDAAISGKDARAAHLWRARALYEIGLYKQACEDLQSLGR
jgi:hypothetical protein